MTNEKAINNLKQLKEYHRTYYGSMYFKVEVKADEEMKETIDTVLSLIKEQQQEIVKYEKIIDKISQNPFNELRVDGIRFCGGDIKQYFERKVEDEK